MATCKVSSTCIFLTWGTQDELRARLRPGLSAQLLLTAHQVPLSTPSDEGTGSQKTFSYSVVELIFLVPRKAWPWSQFIRSKISEPKELTLTRIVVLPSMNSTKTCRTCSCVFVVLKFVLHVPSAFCTKMHKDCLDHTHITPLISQSSWTTNSSAPANQMKVGSWPRRQQINQAKSGEDTKVDQITLSERSFPVECSKTTTTLMILPACRRVFSHQYY